MDETFIRICVLESSGKAGMLVRYVVIAGAYKPSWRIQRMKRGWIEVMALVLAVFAGSWTYFWTALQYPNTCFSREPSGYYGLLTAGFRAGHLYAAIDPRPGLLALKDPYDPVANAPYRVHDMSLWKGRYYVYFGVTPVLILFWPLVALTGYYPTESFAVGLFAFIGFAAAAGVLVALRRRYYPEAPAWVLIAGVLCMAFATPLAVLAQRAQFYQVPIAGAFCLHMLTLAALYGALHSRTRSLLLLALASLLFGLTIGARPNYLPDGVVLVMTWAWLLLRCQSEPRPWGWGKFFGTTFTAFGPACVCGCGLLLYNWLRFGSVTEFGVRYVLAGSKQLEYVPFSLSNLPVYAPFYLFGVGSWSPYFPFFTLPEGSTMGMLRYLPWVWLAPCAFLPIVSVGSNGRARLLFSWIVLASGLLNFLLLANFSGANERYTCDFVPIWILLGAIGALALTQKTAARGRAHNWAAWVVAATAGFSLFVGTATFFQRLPLEGRLISTARLFNWPAYAWERMMGHNYGALRLELELPVGREGRSEPIFQTGRKPDQRDWLLIEYLAKDRARLGFFHAGLGLLSSREFTIPAHRRITVETRCGSLLPPFAHPVFADWSKETDEVARRDLQVTVDGTEVLRAMLECYESAPHDLLIGKLGWSSGGGGERFSGRVLHHARLPLTRPAPPVAALRERSPVELKLFFPSDRKVGSEPLLVTGYKSESDLLYCTYDGANRVKFGLDHYGNGGPQCESIPCDPLVPHLLTVWMGSLAESGTAPKGQAMPWSRRFVVVFDGRVVLNLEQLFYSAAPETSVIGFNAQGSTVVGQRFSGRVVEVRPVSFDRLPALRLEGEFGAVESDGGVPVACARRCRPSGGYRPNGRWRHDLCSLRRCQTHQLWF